MSMMQNKPGNDTELEKFHDNQDFASAKNAELTRQKHRKIVEGACRIFFKKGYHPTSIREIAQACDMSMGQLYHYISCKDDVLFLVHEHMQRLFFEYLKKADIDQIKDPVQKLRQALYYSLQFMVENRKLIQFIYSESKYLDKKYLQIILELDRKNVMGFWYDLLREASIKAPLKGDIDITGSIIVFLQTFMALRGWTLKGIPREQQDKGLVDFVMRGLGLADE